MRWSQASRASQAAAAEAAEAAEASGMLCCRVIRDPYRMGAVSYFTHIATFLDDCDLFDCT